MIRAKPTLYMLIGVPGSGKSTWATKFLSLTNEEDPYYILSTDNYIENYAKHANLTYNDVFKDQIKIAEFKLEETLKFCVAPDIRMNLIWDQTNLSKASRAKKLIKIPDYYNKIALVFPIPDDIEERLTSRVNKNIPQHIFDKMVNSFEYPSRDEGFDMVYEYKG